LAPASFPCPRSVPPGEQVHRITPDVVSITDPRGVKGSLAGSGGNQDVTGMLIVPQAPNLAGDVQIAEESCSLQSNSLCSTILGDFLVRQFPVPTYPSS